VEVKYKRLVRVCVCDIVPANGFIDFGGTGLTVYTWTGSVLEFRVLSKDPTIWGAVFYIELRLHGDAAESRVLCRDPPVVGILMFLIRVSVYCFVQYCVCVYHYLINKMCLGSRQMVATFGHLDDVS